jgi:alkanesulfonate monooxygenase SsuD/methylene tetrahydromethanopterin reductase-like flavin-dependent oxidoreductase (luciferase family)
VTLDQLSGGRLVLGFGIGDDYPDGELACFGELTDAVARGRALDEGLTVLAGLLSGETVDFEGDYYQARQVSYQPTPLAPTGIPIWTAGRWPNVAPIRRAARHQGMMVIQITEPEQVVVLREQLADVGADLDHFDIAVWGQRDEQLIYRSDDRYEAWAAAGTTWFLTGPGPFGLVYEEVREYVAAGPPR